MSPTTGDVLGGRYTLIARIATGGMGEVWRASDEVLKREVAVKTLRPSTTDEPHFAERFREEARHTAMLAHPGIATTYDYGEDDATAYLVMELVPGRDLSQVIKERAPIGAQETTRILRQSAEALAAAHDAGVVHRDIKPGNIILMPNGDVKLTDFGIARALGSAQLTRTGEVIGTPHYLSPEQALGRPASAASDIYALGVVGHEMLTGRRPFDGGTPIATALAQVNDAAPPLPMWVPPRLAGAIMHALAKDPLERPLSAAAFAREIGGGEMAAATTVLPASPTMAMPPVAPPRVAPAPVTPSEPEPKKTNPAVWLIPLLLLASVGGYFAVQFLSGQPTSTPTETQFVTRTVTPTSSTTSSVTTSTQSRTTTEVPKVVVTESDYLGRDGEEVAAQIKALGLGVAPLVSVPSDQPVGVVLSVSPNGQVDRDSTITITVSSGPEPTS